MTEIAYQNKDITSKIFGENLKEKSFNVYGLNIPKVIQVLPTNLPAIEANELRIDNIFLLEDGSFAIFDYESTYKEEDKLKYLSYIIRILKKLKIDAKEIKIRMIVLYTADIKEANVNLDVGCLKFQMESGFLSSINTKKEYKILKHKIEQKDTLTDEEIMKLIILPLTVIGKEGKMNMIKKSIELAKDLQDESKQIFALAGIITFGDKIMSRNYANKVKEWIMMTKVARLFEEEKQEAVTKVAQLFAKEKKDAIEKLRKEKQKEKQEAMEKVREEKQKEKQEAIEKVREEKQKEKQEAIEKVREEKQKEKQEAIEKVREEKQKEKQEAIEKVREEKQDELKRLEKQKNEEIERLRRELAEAKGNTYIR